MPLYRSKHWSCTEWDAYQRSQNKFAYDDESGYLCTDNELTADLFKLLDMLRDWNPNWVINTTATHWNGYFERYMAYKSGYRPESPWDVNGDCGGVPNSEHVNGCAADVHIAGQDDSSASLAETIRAAARAWNLEDKLGLGYEGYDGWCHIGMGGAREW